MTPNWVFVLSHPRSGIKDDPLDFFLHRTQRSVKIDPELVANYTQRAQGAIDKLVRKGARATTLLLGWRVYEQLVAYAMSRGQPWPDTFLGCTLIVDEEQALHVRAFASPRTAFNRAALQELKVSQVVSFLDGTTQGDQPGVTS